MKLNALILLLLVGLALSKVVPKDKKKPKDNKKEVTAKPDEPETPPSSNPEDDLYTLLQNENKGDLPKSQFDGPQESTENNELNPDHDKNIIDFWVSIVEQIFSSSLKEGNVQERLVSMMQLGRQDGLDEEQYEHLLYRITLMDLQAGGFLYSLISELRGEDGLIDENGLEELSLALVEPLDSSKEDIKQTLVFFNIFEKSIKALGSRAGEITESVVTVAQSQYEEIMRQEQITDEEKMKKVSQVIAHSTIQISKILKSLGLLSGEFLTSRALEGQNEPLESDKGTELAKEDKEIENKNSGIYGNIQDLVKKTTEIVETTFKNWLAFLTPRALKVRSLPELNSELDLQWDKKNILPEPNWVGQKEKLGLYDYIKEIFGLFYDIDEIVREVRKKVEEKIKNGDTTTTTTTKKSFRDRVIDKVVDNIIQRNKKMEKEKSSTYYLRN